MTTGREEAAMRPVDAAGAPASPDGTVSVEPVFVEPAFVEPWEARIFALVVALHDRKAFEWTAFQALLIEEIGMAEQAGRPRPYYESWLVAAERLLDSLDLAGRAEVEAEAARLRPDDRTVRLR